MTIELTLFSLLFEGSMGRYYVEGTPSNVDAVAIVNCEPIVLIRATEWFVPFVKCEPAGHGRNRRPAISNLRMMTPSNDVVKVVVEPLCHGAEYRVPRFVSCAVRDTIPLEVFNTA